MALNDVACRQAKPGEKARKLSDERGLYLLIQPTGGKLWRFDYRYEGKRKTLSIGAYPDVSLAAARMARDQAREQIAAGLDPMTQRKQARIERAEAAANSFELIAREWHKQKSLSWTESTRVRALAMLENDLFPWLGDRPIAEILAPELLATLRRIEARGAIESAHRAKGLAGQVFLYAIATGRAERNPAADLRGALSPSVIKHFPAITEVAKVGPLLRALEIYKGSHVVRCALRLAPLLFVRPGELRQAEWSEIDLDAAEWRIPAAKMKKRRDHIVPLPVQAVAILNDLRPLTGHGRYVFQGVRDHSRPMSEATVNAALRRLGYNTQKEITGHGFRAMARTILHEVLDVEAAVIEHQLAHSVPDVLGEAYNRTKFLPQRRQMMQRWADWLDQVRDGAEVIEFKRRAG
ncbi:MAG: integrase arm-type DNA-binding domain-containing protein [Thauera sp.]|jgi:integrase|nr:integrase arm-type DNA-binding domain-containing protein [Thauera sp.]